MVGQGSVHTSGQQAFEFNHIGYGSTLALMLLSFVMLLTLVQWQLRRKWVFHEE
ncbi:hypothetical protein ACIQRJ_17565 [Streptomyces niveus]|uniref:hypothetical protein n=1 Tax=Streptomyces niveus TaxID=193462 RepID=UPI0038377F66